MSLARSPLVLTTRQQLLSLIISNRGVYKQRKEKITPDIFENEIHKKLLNYILAFYSIDKNIEPTHILDLFTEEEDIKEVSLILSLDNQSDDDLKAFDDYLKVISERMNRKRILSHLNADNPDKINALNEILKNQCSFLKILHLKVSLVF